MTVQRLYELYQNGDVPGLLDLVDDNEFIGFSDDHGILHEGNILPYMMNYDEYKTHDIVCNEI